MLLSDESFDRVISVNLKGVFNAMKHACKAMERSGEGGVVISTASTAALCGGGRDAATPAYTAAKGGVVAMTRRLAVEYGIHNIRVNAVAPVPPPGASMFSPLFPVVCAFSPPC